MQGFGALKKSLERLVMLLGFMLFFAILIPGFRTEVGRVLDPVLSPLANSMPFYIVIFTLAMITGVYASLIQKYTVDWKSLRETQAKFKKFREELKEAQRTKNKYKLKRLEERREEIMKEQSGMGMQQLKPMMYTVVITLPIFLWLWWYTKNALSSTILIFPFFGSFQLSHMLLGFIPCWIVWYALCSFAVGQAIRKLLRIGVV